jgi:transposase-like protein
VAVDPHDEVYGVPLSSFKECPRCGSTDAVAVYLFGLPARPPQPHEEHRVVFGGCVIGEGPIPDWRCQECQVAFTDGGRVVADS